MKTLRIGFVFLVALFSVASHANAQEKTKISVKGTVQRAMGIGAETSGWLIQLDKPITIDDKSFDTIEIAGAVDTFAALEHKPVKAKGTLVHKHGVERGDYPVLEVKSIQEIKPLEPAKSNY